MRGFSGVLWGLIFIVAGAAMLLDRFGYMEFDLGRFLHTWWPLILIVIGLGLVFERGRNGRGK
jgi:hypothetical protein